MLKSYSYYRKIAVITGESRGVLPLLEVSLFGSESGAENKSIRI